MRGGIPERDAVRLAARNNKGPSSIAQALERAREFWEAFQNLRGDFDVLAGFTVDGEGQLALAWATKGGARGFRTRQHGRPPGHRGGRGPRESPAGGGRLGCGSGDASNATVPAPPQA